MMNNSLWWVTPVALLMLGACVQEAEPPINKVIGEEAYEALTGREPGDGLDEDARIQIHLSHVERTLRHRSDAHLSPELQQARARTLTRLRQYIQARQFPRNDDHPDARRPTFVDQEGNLCAVGALMAHDLGRPAVASLGAGFKYAFIEDIEHPTFGRWAAGSGLTRRELAMIQPSYRDRPPVRPPFRPPPPPPPPPPVSQIDTAMDIFKDNLGVCFNKHLPDNFEYPEPWLPLEVTWNTSGTVKRLDFQLSRTPEALDTCVRGVAPKMAIGTQRQEVVRFELIKIP